jgi:hypothetical protein
MHLVLELAHVARPVVGQEQVGGSPRKGGLLPPMPPCLTMPMLGRCARTQL